ncbi:type III secretion system export apparatus subunit SctV [Actimicrobium sp. CCI2.3]|uniref:type III secretion system export apparatus subunit SctV n=1 Tax=Actimicrobium sp. CCI2.3 TaxID=3048616 RepID=UPI002AB52FCA|nr:type III secretion system export apparatus subunit SctV [Actimicrobium sp. CCI2.3]MDY7572704.1 type III secretion system export apparatus subunit SctV [Actimicrobium sp. CCI2.3]MEB0022223.1 type III secretion system export apparatus subunit SctV [Actimicrobium sp. CCI2.3]
MNNLVLALNDFAAKAAKRAELFAAALIIAIVFMLVLPMPIWLLDILIAVNLCVAGLMVVVSMYMVGPTSFSTFPAVLLLTTLFRLALEVATTRQILLEGNAGHIVETFGNFVVGGNLVVGLVVFLILTVVQFIVITKGSERVSEVAARFTLDAMPGKQMSIDSDLRAGFLTADDARRKRAELAKESQLHGAMDGAMKFVKGDAIAGIFIVMVNLIGGISIGIFQRSMTVGDASKLYSILSIGDALIAQIPALLISLTAGMITTRVSDDNREHDGAGKSNIGQDIVAEMFAEPKAMVTASVIMVLFGMIPGMPTVIFLGLAALLSTGGALALLKPRAEEAKKRAAEMNRVVGKPKVVDLTTFESTKPFIVRMHKSMEGRPEAETITDAIRIMRNTVMGSRGIPDMHTIDFEYRDSMPADRIHFLMAEVPLVDVEIRLGWGATIETSERLTELGFEARDDGVAGTRRHRTWVRVPEDNSLEEAGVVYQSWETVLASDIEVEMMRNCQMFMGVHEVQRFMRFADRRFPELGKELARTVTLPRLTEVMQRLAREGVSLRNARLILETVLDWSSKERDPDILADYVRLALKRQLCYEVAQNGLIEVILMSPEMEDLLRGAIRQTSQGSYLELEVETEQAILDRLGELIGTGGSASMPPVLVTAADIRRSVRKLIEEEFFSVPVFSFSELTQHARVQPLGMIEL